MSTIIETNSHEFVSTEYLLPNKMYTFHHYPKLLLTRHLFATYGGFYACGLKRNDIVYVPFPIFHTTGGLLGVGMALLFGCTVVLRKKFSASNFWTDCIKYQCTVFLIIYFSFIPSFFC